MNLSATFELDKYACAVAAVEQGKGYIDTARPTDGDLMVAQSHGQKTEAELIGGGERSARLPRITVLGLLCPCRVLFYSRSCDPTIRRDARKLFGSSTADLERVRPLGGGVGTTTTTATSDVDRLRTHSH